MSQDAIFARLARELGLTVGQVERCAALLDEGNTVPFIARYRKEATGEMDENQIRTLQARLAYLRNLEAEKEKVLRVIAEQGKLTPELERAIREAEKLQEVEDLYRPYRPKRRTRAMIARERGLEPLAMQMLAQAEAAGFPEQFAAAYVNPDLGVASAEDALAGARDIVAEIVSDDAAVRKMVRELTFARGVIRSAASDKGDPEKAREFEMYFDFQEPVRTLPPHRVLAINRGERLECLKVTLEAPAEEILARIERQYITGRSIWEGHLREAIADAYRRLILPSIETEIRGELTERAEEHAIRIFALNLRNLLLQPPIKGMTVMGIDPGYRTGCKVAAVGPTGDVLATATVFPHPPQNRWEEALATLAAMARDHGIRLVAIGNGTASRETERLAAQLARQVEGLRYTVVNEAGASVYSASPLARQELPSLDVSMRGAVSIARRLQDPLAELVKIDPQSIGVGLYQHDVRPRRLAEALDSVVESCVNHVGVELNTASPALLRRVSGISPALAEAIVARRRELG
ncbi:MAG: helix-hairpin-helix domain-containing protein, partial [Symbiobacteriaceae bacterium]